MQGVGKLTWPWKKLYFWDGKVTDAGLKELSPLKQLTTLDLQGLQITDASMATLATFDALTRFGT